MPLSELADSNDNKPTRRPTKACGKWLVRHRHYSFVPNCSGGGGGVKLQILGKKPSSSFNY